MKLYLFFSYVTAFTALLLLALFPARKLAQKTEFAEKSTPTFVHKILRKSHSALGFLAIPVAFIHCRLAEQATGNKSMLGGVLLLMLMLMALSYCLKKPLRKYWIYIHRVLAAIFFLLTVLHIVISVFFTP